MPYSAEYKLLHKDEIKRKNRERYHKNKEKYSKVKIEKYRETNSKYYSTSIVFGWKRVGIKVLEDTFEKYRDTTNCELCNKEFCDVGGKTRHNKKALDHDHRSGTPRFIVCYSCNAYIRGRDKRLAETHLELYRYFLRK